MKIKKIFTAVAVMIIMLAFSAPVFSAETVITLAEEIAAGLATLQKLQNKEVSCTTITDSDFELMGKYFMAQMMGDAHEVMNVAIKQRLGGEGEELMHISMGKRFSGCDATAPLPLDGGGFFPMVQMMGGVFTPYNWAGRTMMNGWGMMSGWGGISWAWMFAWYVLLITLIALGVRWLVRIKNQPEKSLLDIVKERYAKGELSKEHFEEIRNELLK